MKIMMLTGAICLFVFRIGVFLFIKAHKKDHYSLPELHTNADESTVRTPIACCAVRPSTGQLIRPRFDMNNVDYIL